MKLIGHSQGFIKLKFNPKIFASTKNDQGGGVKTYGTH